MSLDCNVSFNDDANYYPLSAASVERFFPSFSAFGGDPAPSAPSLAEPVDPYSSWPLEYTFHRSGATQSQPDEEALTLNDIFHSQELGSGDTFTLSSTDMGAQRSVPSWRGISQISGLLVSTTSTGERMSAPCVIFPHVSAALTQVLSSSISQGEHIVEFVSDNVSDVRTKYPLKFSRSGMAILRTVGSRGSQHFASEPQTFENIGVVLKREDAGARAFPIRGKVMLCISAVCQPANNGSAWDFRSLNEPILNESILNEPILTEPLTEPLNNPMGRPNIGIFPF